MMEMIFEFILEVVFGGIFEYAKKDDSNPIIKAIVFGSLVLLYIAILIGLVFLAIISYYNNALAGLLIGLILIAWIMFGIKSIQKYNDKIRVIG